MTKKPSVNPWILGAGALVIVPLVALLAARFGTDPRALPSVLEEKAAPPFALSDLSGQTWTLDHLRGKPVVLNFWSTWCQPCKLEHRLLQQAPARYPQVQFLGVLYADEPAKARPYLEQVGSGFPTLIDPKGIVSIDYGVTGVPETYFISKEGVIMRKFAGPLDAAMLDTFLRPLLEPS